MLKLRGKFLAGGWRQCSIPAGLSRISPQPLHALHKLNASDKLNKEIFPPEELLCDQTRSSPHHLYVCFPPAGDAPASCVRSAGSERNSQLLRSRTVENVGHQMFLNEGEVFLGFFFVVVLFFKVAAHRQKMVIIQ